MVDLTTILLTALASGGLSAIFTMVVAVRLIGGIKGEIEANFPEYIEGLVANLENNPELAKRIVTPLMKAVLGGIQGEKEAMIKIPFLGRVPASILQPLLAKFLGAGQDKAVETATAALGLQ